MRSNASECADGSDEAIVQARQCRVVVVVVVVVVAKVDDLHAHAQLSVARTRPNKIWVCIAQRRKNIPAFSRIGFQI